MTAYFCGVYTTPSGKTIVTCSVAAGDCGWMGIFPSWPIGKAAWELHKLVRHNFDPWAGAAFPNGDALGIDGARLVNAQRTLEILLDAWT